MTIQVIFTGAIIIAVVALGIVYVKTHTLEQIRGEVYNLFVVVEHKYIKSGEGEKKLTEVVDRAYELLPSWARLFLTKKVLRKIIDEWFCKVKDLLDDGKMNNSANGGTLPGD